MSGKPQNIKRTRRSFGRAPFTRSPKRFRQLFINEMKRSNNPLRGCEAAGISLSDYQQWLHDGFLTETMLAEALATFKQRHPNIDSLPRNKPDDQPLNGLPLDDPQVLSLDEQVLNDPEDWIGTSDYYDEW